MSALTNLQSQLSGSLATLSGRERRMVIIGGLALGVFLVFMVTMGFSNKAAAIRRRTAEKVLKLDEVQALAANYNQQKASQDALERQLASSNVRLMSYLEDKAKKAGIELQSQNPKADVPLEGSKIIESGVELTLTDIKLNRLVDFLAAVEAGPGIVKVKYVRLEPRVASETITAWLIISTYHLK